MDHDMHDSVAQHAAESEGQMASSSSSRSTRSSKKRGASQGVAPLPNGMKRLIRTNNHGQPNEMDEDTKALAGDIGLAVRETLPVGYDSFDKLPEKPVEDVMKTLQTSYDLKYVNSDWLNNKIMKSWRDKKYRLRKKYIYGKDLAIVRASPDPDFVTHEDWHTFIDMSITPAFKAISERAKANRKKLDMPNASGRFSAAQIRHRIAIERNLDNDDDVGRSDTFISMHTKKDKTEQCPEKMDKMKTIMRENPEKRVTAVDDALAMTLGKDTRGCMRAIGPGVSPTFIKKTTHMVHKIVDAQREIKANDSKLDKLEKKMGVFEDYMTKNMAKNDMEKNVSSPRSTSSSAPSFVPPHQDIMDIGKRCDVYCWNDLVAHGEVVEVDPKVLVHNVPIGEGNYKIMIDIAVDRGAPLFKRNSQVTVIEDVVNGYTVWPKQFLKFVS